ncbi:ABC transporter ATP-binding protein [Halococcus hamelinensis]|uniref:Nickel import system ATP-binding protein NikD n=1 Tax=Halococcus hamelinensis 100A6 TaxID=1132509 RepID=M0LYJ7_9EURY|nr:ABC transporter ATP-binding protein [Halococcus hamelinensis]EMA37185.1 oligopeptide/dipeptide ABC transporter ATPase [Halococcus hamelinensis 100A6]
MNLEKTNRQSNRNDRRKIISARDVAVTFEMDRGTSRVLNDVNMDIYDGEIVGIVGESGSGKSMFADALLNAVVDPGVASGEIRYTPEEGESLDVLGLEGKALREFRWNDVSMVFQGALSAFNPTIRVGAHFKETLSAHGVEKREGMEWARQLLADLYLDPNRVLESYPHELSGGMKQRALIALSLLLEPDMLVMDEPTAALDLLMQRSIIRLLREVRDKYNLTMVFITHDLPLVARLADRLAVMYAFEFVETGPTEKILTEPSHPYTRELLNATPDISAPIDQMKPVEGAAPDPVTPPAGCSYHPRCPLADERCEAEAPPFQSVSQNHEAACFHWEQAVEEIPMASQGGNSDE